MRRAATLITLTAVLVTGLVMSTGASAKEPGFNLPTKRLEGAYKFALQDRRFDPAGCYAPPGELAGILTRATGHKVGVAKGTGKLRVRNRVYVIKKGTNCNRLRMALRAGSIYVLDSHLGTVRIQGRKGAATPGLAQTLRRINLATQTYRLSKPDTAPRLEVLCPRGKYPIGGGMSQSPTVGSDGEGIYPHSYERLGAQRGYHISVVVLDARSPAQTASREVTVQTVCGKGVIPATPTPHKTVWVRSGQTKTVTARCPKGQFLVSGGFQRTNFRSDGGDYITESRAASKKAWTVTGSAYGTGQGELTAIAYCARMKKPRLTEVTSSPTPIAADQLSSTTTPSCPKGKRLVAGGFSNGNGSPNAFFAEGTINQNNSFTARSYGFFGPVSGLTAYGYCWPAK
ncbi:MAG TPA: hypothetical protein VH501_05750 [Solirubrobacterales bacterium]|jgi:hypothetical protein